MDEPMPAYWRSEAFAEDLPEPAPLEPAPPARATRAGAAWRWLRRRPAPPARRTESLAGAKAALT